MLDKQKVVTAVDHVRAAADLHAPVLDELLREMDGISATSEWNEWTKRDPDTAEWLDGMCSRFAGKLRVTVIGSERGRARKKWSLSNRNASGRWNR